MFNCCIVVDKGVGFKMFEVDFFSQFFYSLNIEMLQKAFIIICFPRTKEEF